MTECAVDPRAAIAQVSISIEEKSQKTELQSKKIKDEKWFKSLQSSHPKVRKIFPLAYSLRRTTVHITVNNTVFNVMTRTLWFGGLIKFGMTPSAPLPVTHKSHTSKLRVTLKPPCKHTMFINNRKYKKGSFYGRE
jgi:hypothetical protein